MSRFDFIRYDEKAQLQQAKVKSACEMLERAIEENVMPGTRKQDALKSLEECYMWTGKAIRDEQIMRNGGSESNEDRVCL